VLVRIGETRVQTIMSAVAVIGIALSCILVTNLSEKLDVQIGLLQAISTGVSEPMTTTITDNHGIPHVVTTPRLRLDEDPTELAQRHYDECVAIKAFFDSHPPV
jgi:hypothetical protein